MRRVNSKTAFTLIELLVVVSIIALLVSILLPALGKAREQARSALCMSNLRQLMLAQIYYADVYGVYAVYYQTGNPPIHYVQDYVGMDFKFSAAIWSEPAGTIVNIPPYVCPDLPPAVKTGPPGNTATDGNPYPYGWNSRLGFWLYGDRPNPVVPYISPDRVRRPSGVVGWADAMHGSAGVIHGPNRRFESTGWVVGWGVDWAPYFRPPAPRHGGGLKGLEPYGSLGIETLSLYPSGAYANGAFLDGHCERIDLAMIDNDSLYGPD